MLAYFDLSLDWRELMKRTVRETSADNGLGLAAQLAYYFFLALFPALLFLVALAGLFTDHALVSRIVSMLEGVAPPEVSGIIREQLAQISASGGGGILTLGIIGALWSSSAAMVAIVDALNRAYDVEDARPWWRQRLSAVLLTIGVAVFLLLSVVLMMAGPQLAEYVADQVGFGTAFEWAWKILQWPAVFALVATAFGLIYYFAPDVDQDFAWLTPGSVLATALWFIASVAFRFYVVNFGAYNATYGAIGGVIVLLLWLYITGFVIIVGAEMNAEIEHAAPHGKAPGEKQPGRKVIGARAAREFQVRREQGPVAAHRPPAVRPRPGMAARALTRGAVLLTGIVAGLLGRRIQN